MNAKAKTYPQARAAGLYDSDAVSLETGLKCLDVSLTDQDGREEADINTIVQRYHLTGEIPVTRRVPFPQDVDCDEILDYRECAERLRAAQLSYESLPADVRERFGNDYVAFADYASDPKNLDQLITWGLAPPKPEKPA